MMIAWSSLEASRTESEATQLSSTPLIQILGPKSNLKVRNGHAQEPVTVPLSMTIRCGSLVVKTMTTKSLTTSGVTLSQTSNGNQSRLTPKLFQDRVILLVFTMIAWLYLVEFMKLQKNLTTCLFMISRKLVGISCSTTTMMSHQCNPRLAVAPSRNSIPLILRMSRMNHLIRALVLV